MKKLLLISLIALSSCSKEEKSQPEICVTCTTSILMTVTGQSSINYIESIDEYCNGEPLPTQGTFWISTVVNNGITTKKTKTVSCQ